MTAMTRRPKEQVMGTPINRLSPVTIKKLQKLRVFTDGTEGVSNSTRHKKHSKTGDKQD